MLQYRNGTVRQKYIHGWEVKSPRIYCKQQWWFRFFIKSRLLLFIFHVQLYFPFFPDDVLLGSLLLQKDRYVRFFFSLARSALVFFLSLFCCWLYIFFLRCSTSNDEYGVRTKNTDWRWVRELATLFFLSVSRYILYCSQQNSLVEAVPTLLHHHCLLIIICSWIIRLANCICSSLIFFSLSHSLTLACSVFMLFELLMHHLLHLHFLPFK